MVATSTITQRFLQMQARWSSRPILTRIQGYEAFNDEYAFELEVLLNDEVDVHSILQSAVDITIASPQDGGARHVNGVIIAAEKKLDVHPPIFQYHLTIAPQFSLLKHTSDCRIFKNQSVLDIVKTLLSEHNINHIDTSRLSQSYPSIQYCTQFNESYYDFIKRILAEQGISYYFQHAAGKHTMTFIDQPASFPLLEKQFRVSQNQHLQANQLSTLRLKQHVLNDSHASSDYDYTKPLHDLRVTHIISKENYTSLKNPLELFHYPSGQHHTADAERQLACQQQYLSRENASFITHGCNVKMKPAIRFTVDDPSRSVRTFAVARVFHEASDFSQLPNYSADQQHVQQYRNTVTCYPASLVLSPKPRLKPKMPGTQTATVVGDDSQVVNTDEYGRVKVLFHWQQGRGSMSSRWVRVKQKLAGARWGTLFIPRVGSEVIVGFIHNDPDRPIVIGQAYNAASQPPYPSDQPQLTGMKSQSFLQSDDPPINEIQFDDSPKQQVLKIHAGRDMETAVTHDHVMHIGRSQIHTIKQGHVAEDIKGDNRIEANQGIRFECGDSHLCMNAKGITLNGPLININPGVPPPVTHPSFWGDLAKLFNVVKRGIEDAATYVEENTVLSDIAETVNNIMNVRDLVDIGNMALGAVEAAAGVPLDEIGVGELLQEDAVKREIVSGSDLAESYAARTAEKDISAGTVVKEAEKDPVLPASQLPKNPDDLVTKHGYNETTHPDAKLNGHRRFEHPKNGDDLRFDKGEPKKLGHKAKDHYHRLNPNDNSKKYYYLDKYNKPCSKGSNESHLYSEET